MTPADRKILSLEHLVEVRREFAEQGKTVVQCHGCFDIVHPGHIRYLQFAREQGDVLIVSISGDDVVGKGFDRPYITEQLRAENLAALEFVDYVTIDHHDWAGPVLESLKPDIYIKGKEYETNSDPRFVRERRLVEKFGGKVIFSSGEVVYSSTFIIDKFRDEFALEQQKLEGFCRRHGITCRGLEKRINAFSDRRVLVLGDPILDQYIHCESRGVASESPMLTVSPVHHEWYVGAGGLIARQFAALGAETTFLTAFGATAQATRFAQVLDNDGIGLDAVEVDDRQVFLKSRYLVDDQKVFKVNHGRYVPASTRATEQLIERVDAHLSDHDGLVVTDFGYGLFGPKLIGAIGDLASKHQKPYFVDVSGTGTSNLLKFRRPMVSTPTESELRFACGDQESGLSHLAVNYFERTGAQQLALTLGKRGALLFEPPDSGPRGKRSQAEYLPSMSNHAIDPVGAGDVFLSGVVATNLAGGSQFEGVFLGSCLASLHIARMGNDPTSYAMLTSFLNERAELRG